MKDAERILATIRIVTLIMFLGAVPLLFKFYKSCDYIQTIDSVLYPEPAILSGESALNEVKGFLKISPRVSGTENAERAAQYIYSVLSTNGLEAVIDEFEDDAPSGKVTFRNIEAYIPGAVGESTVLLISHYDTKAGMNEDFQGANDSGSSTGLLLELAESLSKSSRYPFNIIVAFVDGEECINRYSMKDGLHGSRHLADKLLNKGSNIDILAAIVVDMIGDKDLTVTVPSNCSPKLTALLFKSAEQLGFRNKFRLLRQGIIDDHSPFFEKNVPALDIIDFEFGEKPGGNEYWHTEQDTIDKLSAESLEITGRVLIQMLNNLAKDS